MILVALYTGMGLNILPDQSFKMQSLFKIFVAFVYKI